MRCLAASCLFFMFAACAPTGPGTPTWAKSYGGPAIEQAAVVAEAVDGGFVFAGQHGGGTESDGDLWLAKVDDFGDVVWQSTYGRRAAGSAGDQFALAREGQSGSVWVVGTRAARHTQGTGEDVVLTLLDRNGNALWTRAYDSGPFPGHTFLRGSASDDEGYDVWPTRDGGALVAGIVRAFVRREETANASGFEGAPVAAVWCLKVDAAGVRQWSRVLIENGFDWGGVLAGERPGLFTTVLIRETSLGGAVAAATGCRWTPSDSDGDGRRDGWRETDSARIWALGATGDRRWTQGFEGSQRGWTIREVLQLDQDRDGTPEGDFLVVGAEPRRATDLNLTPRRGMARRLAFVDGAEVWNKRRSDTTEIVGAAQRVAGGALEIGMMGRALGGGIHLSTSDVDGDETNRVQLSEGIAPQDVGQRVRGVGTDFVFLLRRLGDGLVLERRGAELQLSGTVAVPGRSDWTMTGDGGMLRLLAPPREGVLQRLDPRGQIVWERTLGAARVGEAAVAVVPVPDRTGRISYVVLGTLQTDDGHTGEAGQAWLLALDANGGIVWQRTYPGFRVAPGHRPICRDGDTFVLIGRHADALRAMRVSLDGQPLAISRPLGPPTTSEHKGTAILAVRTGGFLVSGEGGSSSWLARLGAAFEPVWQYRLDRSGSIQRPSIGSLVESPRGFAVSGILGELPWAMQLDPSGEIEWVYRYQFGQDVSRPWCRLCATQDGQFVLATTTHDPRVDVDTILVDEVVGGVVVGVREEEVEVPLAPESGRRNFLIARLDAEGRSLWAATFGGLFDEVLQDACAPRSGGFLFAGGSDSVGERQEAWLVRTGPDGRVNPNGCNAALGRANVTATAVTMERRPFEASADDVPPALPAVETTTVVALVPAPIRVARQCHGSFDPDAEPDEPDRVPDDPNPPGDPDPDPPDDPNPVLERLVWAVYRLGEHDDFEIYRLQDGAQVSRLTTHPANDHSPAWSPDRNHVVFVSDRDRGSPPRNNPELYVMEASGSDVQPLPSLFDLDFTARDPVWSPLGDEILVVGQSPGVSFLYALAVDDLGGSLQFATEFEPLFFRAGADAIASPTFSPDGTRVAFEAGGLIVVFDRTDPDGRRELVAGSEPDWSPETGSAKVAFARSGNLYTYDVDAEVEAELLVTAETDGSPSWSRDGSTVYFVRQEAEGPKVMKLTVATGALEEIPGQGSGNVDPDG